MKTKAKDTNEASASVWDNHYVKNDIPWQSSGLDALVLRYLEKYAPGKDLLELGAGNGPDAKEFIDLGYKYTGIELSKKAADLARNNLDTMDAEFIVADFFKWSSQKKFDVVYDKGMFHNLANDQRRLNFVKRVANCLKPNGIWITVSGAADCYDSSFRHGAIYLQDLIDPLENYFEVLEIIKSKYNTTLLHFDGWYCVLKLL